jgi:hypothetical protein
VISESAAGKLLIAKRAVRKTQERSPKIDPTRRIFFLKRSRKSRSLGRIHFPIDETMRAKKVISMILPSIPSGPDIPHSTSSPRIVREIITMRDFLEDILFLL